MRALCDEELKIIPARINEANRPCREGVIRWQERVRLLNAIAPGIGDLAGQKMQVGMSHKLKANAPRVHHLGGR